MRGVEGRPQVAFQQFTAGLPGGGSGERRGSGGQGRAGFPVPLEVSTLRTMLQEALSNYNRPIGVGKSPIWYVYQKLRDYGAEALLGEENEEKYGLIHNVATAVGILGYEKLPGQSQYLFWNNLRREMEYKPDRFTLNEQGRRILHIFTTGLDIPYDPQQTEFSRLSILNRPEPEMPTDEDYIQNTEKAHWWEGE